MRAIIATALGATVWSLTGVLPAFAVSSLAQCRADGPCDEHLCPPGFVCVYAPKQCFTTPCPQYDCVPRVSAAHAAGVNS
jgi:hypothetical protein